MFELDLNPASAHELFVIDGAVPDLQSLIAAIGPDKSVVVLDPQRDGVLQLADLLSNESGLDAIQVLSHGSVGCLSLGTAVLNEGSITSYSPALEIVGKALTASGDLLLYGCDVAQGEVGQNFIGRLAAITGADVAASNDITGAGGNWMLEQSTGEINASAIGETLPIAFPYQLLDATTPTPSVAPLEYALLAANAYGLGNNFGLS